jgi:hypothetical protein
MERFAYLALGLITIITAIFLCIIFFGEDRYRYDCQDPEQWSQPQCNAPICQTSGTCTKDIIHRVEKVAIDEKADKNEENKK